MTIKSPGSKIFSFCFHFEDGKACDERVTVELDNLLMDYSQFLNAWDLVSKALE
jgi:hypothetical protein